jgi:hypothetical protein
LQLSAFENSAWTFCSITDTMSPESLDSFSLEGIGFVPRRLAGTEWLALHSLRFVSREVPIGKHRAGLVVLQ